MQYKKLLLLICVLSFSACKKDNDGRDPALPDKINFTALEVGQQTTYIPVYPICSDFFNVGMDSMFSLTIDTVVVTVTSANGNRFVFSEVVFPTVDSRIEKSEQLYEVRSESDFILIPERDSSRLFWFYANDTIHLRPQQLTEMKQEECLFYIDDDKFVGNEIGILDKYELEGIAFEDKYIVSCLPQTNQPLETIFDGYLIYDEFGLVASHQITSMLIPIPQTTDSIAEPLGLIWLDADYH